MRLGRNDLLDLRDLLLEHPFDAVFQGHLRHRAACAMPYQFDLDDPVFNIDEFHIAAVGYQCGADFIQGFFYFRLKVLHFFSF